MDTMEQIQYSLPVQHLSYSALRLYCANRQQFKKNYIEGRWERMKESMVALVGSGFHKTMELHMMGWDLQSALAEGYKVINDVPAEKLNFDVKKRENLLQELAQTVQFFMNEKPEFGKVLATETSFVTDCIIEGELMPLPIKAKTDMVTEMESELHLWDWKVVTAFSQKEADPLLSPEENKIKMEKPDYIIQAMFNYHVARQSFKKDPAAMHFVEVKKTANQDKSLKQVQLYTINFKEHPEYFKYFKRLYEAFIVDVLNSNLQYLPNFGDPFTGQESWAEFIQEPDLDFTLDVSKIKAPKPVTLDRVESAKQAVQQLQVQKQVTKENAYEGEVGDIVSKFAEFGIPVTPSNSYTGPSVTLYTFTPSRGVSMAKIKQYEDDLMIALGAESCRIIAPIIGTKTIGVEVGSTARKTVELDSKLRQKTSCTKSKTLMIPIGVDVYGKAYSIDLAKNAHILVAGTTGSGKSVFLNACLQSLPTGTETILIDPKGTEFGGIDEVPMIHETLEKLIDTMNHRYLCMKEIGVRSINAYNEKSSKKMKRIVVVADELADIFLTKETFERTVSSIATKNKRGDIVSTSERSQSVKYGPEIKNLIIKLAQKSRAAGIHLILATQRPSVDVVDGILKANLPTRIAFRTASAIDSQVILDTTGAERLLGDGDLLLMDPAARDLIRLQGYYAD